MIKLYTLPDGKVVLEKPADWDNQKREVKQPKPVKPEETLPVKPEKKGVSLNNIDI
jgi:hypothetical protein